MRGVGRYGMSDGVEGRGLVFAPRAPQVRARALRDGDGGCHVITRIMRGVVCIGFICVAVGLRY